MKSKLIYRNNKYLFLKENIFKLKYNLSKKIEIFGKLSI